MRRITALGLGALCILLTACPFADKQSLARDAASELNLNSRFDRTQMVMEHVAAKERVEFTRSHHAWGGEVRVTDAEISGFKMLNPNEAEVQVHVAWFLLGEGELRSTMLRQNFEDDKKGHFMLVKEERIEGDIGLLGERMERAKPPPELAAPPAQFPTVRIGENDTL
jgi:hypothetical protein